MGKCDLGHWDWEKCQKWEWDKYFVTMTSRDITYFQDFRKVKKVFKHLVRVNFGILSQRLFVFFLDRFAINDIGVQRFVYHQSPNNEQADNFSASNSDCEEEVDSALGTTLSMPPSDQSWKNNNTYKSDDRLPAGRNERNYWVFVGSYLEALILWVQREKSWYV